MSRPPLNRLDALAIAAGGILGSLLRIWVGLGFEGDFPVPTLLVNLAGAAALGLLYGWQHRLPPTGIHLYMVGFCGSFTTVSLFAFETLELLQEGRMAAALGYLLLPTLTALGMVAWIVPRAEAGSGGKGRSP